MSRLKSLGNWRLKNNYMFRLDREITSIHPDTILSISGFKITNTTLLSLLILILLGALCFFSIRKFQHRPNKTQTFVEMIVEAMLGLIAQITGSVKNAQFIFPLVATIFVYLAISNLIGMIPGLTSITFGGASIFRSPTTDFNTTFGLAIGCVVVLNMLSMKDWGFFGHLGKFFKIKEIFHGFKKSISDGLMAIIDFAIGLLDIVGEIAKVISLSLRLFGNMYAGEVLATLMLGAFAYFVPIAWSAMSLLSGVVQAIVFGALVSSYYMLALKEEEPVK